MNRSSTNSLGIIIPGSSSNYDLSISISLIKNKLKNVLLTTQKLDPFYKLYLDSQDPSNGTLITFSRLIILPSA